MLAYIIKEVLETEFVFKQLAAADKVKHILSSSSDQNHTNADIK
jgi:hypothetical protein